MKRSINFKVGFTLIEILAVMFIIGIIFSLTMPAFGPVISNMRLSTAIENLANTLESARQNAKTSGKERYVIFPTTGDMAYKAYKIYNYDDKKSIGKTEVLPIGISVDKKSEFMKTLSDINFPEDNSPSTVTVGCVKFKSNGSGYTGGSIVLANPNANISQKITISATSVEVEIKDMEKL